MSKKRNGRKPVVWFLGMFALLLLPAVAMADVPYDTFTRNSYGRVLETQPAYAPAGVLAAEIPVAGERGKMAYESLSRPQDLYIDASDQLYIADTDNNRIVHLDAAGKLVRILTVPESPLNQPQGVFVTGNGDIFIADTGNKRVVRLNREGKLIQEITRPKSKFINDSFVYEPTNMAVDQRGFVYVVSSGSYHGIAQFDPQGNFKQFYGTNRTEVSWMDLIRRQFYSKEQLSRQVKLLPVTIRNLDIDAQGFIYTVSGSASEQVKKLNIRGTNVWRGRGFEPKIPWMENEPQLTDISVDHNGNLTLIDKARNVISQYDSNGNLLFYWTGGSTTGNALVGLTKAPVAVATNSKNELFILDEALNLIQVLKPTTFGTTVFEAYKLMQDGKYAEGEKYWKKVLKLNAFFSPAYKGLAQAAYYRGEYERAGELYRLAGDSPGYSDSFWQLRLQWFQRNFSTFADMAITFAVAVWMVGKLKRRYKFRLFPKAGLFRQPLWLQQLKHAFYLLRHPLEGFSDLRYTNRGGYLSAGILIIAALAMLLVRQYNTSFTFNPVPEYDKDAGSTLTIFLSIWLSWVICNYLIGSIRQGEARFKDVFVGSSYALFPVILLGMPLALLSNGLTLSEASIYHSVEWLMIMWGGMLFYWNIQALQNYGVGETFVNILLTMIAMITLWVIVFILMGLSSEFVEFIYSIYQEVSM